MEKKGKSAAKSTTLSRAVRRAPFFLICPFLFFYCIFFILPLFYSLILSFFQYRGYGTARFVGLANYRAIFSYSVFYTALKNVLFYYLVHTPPMLVISFLLAYLLHGKYAKMKKLFKSLIFLPQVMAGVTAALIFRILFATHSGVINSVLHTSFGFLDPANPYLMKISVVILIMWKGIGWYMIIFLSGLSGVDSSVLESAIIDGVNPLQNLWYMVLPLMRPILLLALVFETMGSLKLAVEPNLLLSNTVTGAPVQATPMLNLVLSNIQGGSFGMASAAGWIITVIIFAFTIVQMRLSIKETT